MGKIITYIIYFLIAVAIYVLIRAAYNGSINKESTMGEMATQVTNDSAQTIKDMGNAAANIVKD